MTGVSHSMLDRADVSRRAALLGIGTAAAMSPSIVRATGSLSGFHDVRDYGAKGDGRTVDSDAINKAIVAASRAGGGTVVVPPGRYLSFSIRLRDDVTIALASGAIIEAADPDTHPGSYDAPENYLEEQFQDFGITHVHNSLIYGDGVRNAAIVGRGMLHGLGLDREGPGSHWHGVEGWQSAKALSLSPRELRLRDPKERAQVGRANKTIGLMNCRNILLRDFTTLQAGHFSVIAHGVTNMTIDALTIDTDRDGIDIDCCRDVRVSDCIVNAPKDDAIVLKSSYALGRKTLCEDIAITGCKTSGYLMGSLLDGSYRKSDYMAPDKIGPLGRIKMGTETNGGFRNILISGCTCEASRGLLIGVVDGGTMEDVIVSDIVMRDPVNHPLFVHQSGRLRAPRGTAIGKCRRIRFDNINVSGANPRFPCGLTGQAGYPVEDISFSNILVQSAGGGTAADAARTPEERPTSSLEVSYLGTLPAQGLYARHARRLTVRNVGFIVDTPDARPLFRLDDVQGATIDGVTSAQPRDNAVVQHASSDIALGDVRTLG